MVVDFDFPLPFTLNSYYVYEKISKGAYGAVFKATSSKYPERLFAIKFQDLTNNSSLNSYNNEVNALMNLIHPNIILMYDFGKLDDYGFIVFEYCETNLKDMILQKSSLSSSIDWNNSQDIAEKIFPQVIAGLNNIHENSFIHRDIKPENILITKEGRIKIADFGFSKKVDECEKVQKLAGTLRYIAPEVTGGAPYDGFAVDIYATGIVFFQCLQGLNLPWECPNLANIKDIVGMGIVQLPASVPRKIIQIIKLMMNYKPVKRPTASDLSKLFPLHKISRISNNSSIFKSTGILSLNQRYVMNKDLILRRNSK